MDFTGLGKFTAFKLDRPLAPEELGCELKLGEQVSTEPQDWLSVIKLNDTYLELVDRWYPIRGFAAWMGILLLAVVAFGLIVSFLPLWDWLYCEECLARSGGGFPAWGVPLVGAPLLVPLALLCVYLIRLDCFRYTHYPIRLNRKTRQVYAFRPDGTVIRASWDDLFLCAVKNELTMWQSSEDVRAHVLEEDGETVKDTFTLAYPFLGDEAGLMRVWEYIRRYMEDPDGVEQNFTLTELCMPVDGRREGLTFGLMRTFAPYAKWPVIQLLASPLWALTTLGRWLAMYTSKVPTWPADIEAACRVDPGDPYQKDWCSNGKYDFHELGWPIICFFVGLLVMVGGVVWLLSVIA